MASGSMNTSRRFVKVTVDRKRALRAPIRRDGGVKDCVPRSEMVCGAHPCFPGAVDAMKPNVTTAYF